MPRNAFQSGMDAKQSSENLCVGNQQKCPTFAGCQHYGLNDSPAGLAAWIVEKYRTWSDYGGDVESRCSKDILLTTATIYWVTQTINSSTWFYYENRRKPWNMAKGEGSYVPCAIAEFLYEINGPPREWADVFTTSNSGRSCRVEGTLPPLKSRLGWLRTFGTSFGCYGSWRDSTKTA